jgi:hypothetical protein
VEGKASTIGRRLVSDITGAGANLAALGGITGCGAAAMSLTPEEAAELSRYEEFWTTELDQYVLVRDSDSRGRVSYGILGFPEKMEMLIEDEVLAARVANRMLAAGARVFPSFETYLQACKAAEVAAVNRFVTYLGERERRP